MNEHGQTNREPKHDRVVQALETIVQALVGEDIESFRHSVEELESNLSRRIDVVREETTTTLVDSRRELAARFEELDKKLAAAEENRAEALANLEDRTERAFAELRRQLETTQTQAESRTEATREALEHQLEATDRSLKEHLDGLAHNLATVQLGLQQQMETSERLSSVLRNLASIFSGQASAAAVSSVEANLSDAEEKKEIESVLDKMFPAGS